MKKGELKPKITPELKKKIKEILNKSVKENKSLKGLVVYYATHDSEKPETIVATTYPPAKTKEIISVRREYRALGEKVEKKYPAGNWSWSVTSLARHYTFAIALLGDLVLAGEFSPDANPTEVIEEMLEIAVMVNDLF
jgi:hypothetical protein